MTVGCVAGDEESYEVFADLLDDVIDKRHGGYPKVHVLHAIYAVYCPFVLVCSLVECQVERQCTRKTPKQSVWDLNDLFFLCYFHIMYFLLQDKKHIADMNPDNLKGGDNLTPTMFFHLVLVRGVESEDIAFLPTAHVQSVGLLRKLLQMH